MVADRVSEALSGPNPSYASLLRQRSFSYLWIGQLVSQSGDAIFDVALLWLVLITTGSTALVGITQAAVLVPSVLAYPLAGVYADRVNRRNMMVLSNIVQGVITAAISVLYVINSLNFSFLVVLILMLYTGAQFYRAANSAIIPRIVSKENLGAANGLFTLTTSANQLVSYSIGGIVILALGPTVPIAYDSLTFFLAAVMLSFVARSYGQPRTDAADPLTASRSFWKDFGEGLTYVRQSRFMLELIILGLLVNFFGGALFTLLAPYAKIILLGDASTYGFLLATFSMGTVVGSVLTGKLNFRGYVGKLAFLGIALLGCMFIAAGTVANVVLALAIFFSMGFVLSFVNIPLQVLVQTQVPGGLLGRVSTVLGSLLASCQPIAAVLSGSLATIASIDTIFLASGLAIILIPIAFYWVFGELRRARY